MTCCAGCCLPANYKSDDPYLTIDEDRSGGGGGGGMIGGGNPIGGGHNGDGGGSGCLTLSLTGVIWDAAAGKYKKMTISRGFRGTEDYRLWRIQHSDHPLNSIGTTDLFNNGKYPQGRVLEFKRPDDTGDDWVIYANHSVGSIEDVEESQLTVSVNQACIRWVIYTCGISVCTTTYSFPSAEAALKYVGGTELYADWDTKAPRTKTNQILEWAYSTYRRTIDPVYVDDLRRKIAEGNTPTHNIVKAQ